MLFTLLTLVVTKLLTPASGGGGGRLHYTLRVANSIRKLKGASGDARRARNWKNGNRRVRAPARHDRNVIYICMCVFAECGSAKKKCEPPPAAVEYYYVAAVGRKEIEAKRRKKE